MGKVATKKIENEISAEEKEVLAKLREQKKRAEKEKELSDKLLKIINDFAKENEDEKQQCIVEAFVSYSNALNHFQTVLMNGQVPNNKLIPAQLRVRFLQKQ